MKRLVVMCACIVGLTAIVAYTVGCGSIAPTLPSPDLSAPSSYDIYGKVTQDNGPVPLSGASVVAGPETTAAGGGKQHDWSDITDANGDYRLTGFPPGTYVVTFSHELYADVEEIVTVTNADVELNVDMHEPPYYYE